MSQLLDEARKLNDEQYEINRSIGAAECIGEVLAALAMVACIIALSAIGWVLT